MENLANRQVICNDCKSEFVIDLITRPAGKKTFEVGFECIHCHKWYRVFFTSPSLERKRKLLNKFRAKAARSDKDWQRWQRKRKQFKQSFDRFNKSTETVE